MPSLFDPAHQPADLDGRLVAALERVGLAFRVLLWEKAKAVREAASLSPIQIQILVFLRYHGEDLARVGRLAEELGLTPATVSDAVAALVAKGLVAKAPGATDRRVQRLCLTAAGARAAEALGDWADAVRGPLAGLSETEKAALLQALLTLLAAMQRDGILATARMCPTCRHFVADRHAGAEQPHHCLLLDRPLAPRDLRVDCPEHAARAA